MKKNILTYTLKVIILFLILFFTFEEPTGLGIIFYLFPLLYILVFLAVLLIVSKIPNDCNKTANNIFNRHIKQPLLLVLGVGIIFILLYGMRHIHSLIETSQINNFIKEADEILYYEDSEYILDGIKDTKFTKNVILIDYDDKKIAFLFRGSYDRFEEFELLENNNSDASENVQISANLNSPGLSLKTFYPDESNDHRTSAIQLLMKDGTVYSVRNIKEHDTGYYYYLGLKWSQYNINK